MSQLTTFGLFAVIAMLVCYALGVVELIWSGVAVRRWWLASPFRAVAHDEKR